MINLIASVIKYKNKLLIGDSDSLILRLKDDLIFFKNTTLNSFDVNSKLGYNILLMGRKTYFSIPKEKRPLKGRLNLILTRNKSLIKITDFRKLIKNMRNISEVINDSYFISLSQFEKLYKEFNPNVFVIGGSEIYNIFLKRVEKIYITEISLKFKLKDKNGYIYMDNFNSDYRLVGYSEKFEKERYIYRILMYRRGEKTDENLYINLLKRVLSDGIDKSDRTGVGTISKCGEQLIFNIKETLPLLTTKNVMYKTVLEELLWFCRGDTDTNILKEKGIKIWDGNTSREFLDKNELGHYPEGVLGAGYGWQMRYFGAEYSCMYSDTSKIYKNSISGGFDQLEYVEYMLKNDPFSRRIMMSYWNPCDFKKTALLPCHYSVMFYVSEENGKKYLSGHFVMRSSDVFLGLPFNIASYATLVYILALKCDMEPKELVYSCNDCHVYKNHVTQIFTQIKRDPRPYPILKLDNNIKNKDWEDIKSDDFELIGYFPHCGLKAEMAI